MIPQPILLRLLNFMPISQNGVLSWVPLMQHRCLVLDPKDVHLQIWGAIDDIPVHGPPPQQVFIIAADLKKEFSSCSLNAAGTGGTSKPSSSPDMLKVLEQFIS